jgi:hypothetical protein
VDTARCFAARESHAYYRLGAIQLPANWARIHPRIPNLNQIVLRRNVICDVPTSRVERLGILRDGDCGDSVIEHRQRIRRIRYVTGQQGQVVRIPLCPLDVCDALVEAGHLDLWPEASHVAKPCQMSALPDQQDSAFSLVLETLDCSAKVSV